ncbi:unnamed protein product [Symbiodinium microadriaticum]|nr:unnamed protein product [Symbiodinium microadriaticum]
MFLKQSYEDKIRYLQEVHIYNTFHGGNIIPKIDPPMGIGLDGQPFVLDDDDSHFEGGGASGSYYMQQQSPKKRGRKKKLDFNGLENQEQDRPIVKRPRTAYSLFAHQERGFLSGIKCGDMQRAMGRYLGQRWKSMDVDERRLYEALSASGAQTK